MKKFIGKNLFNLLHEQDISQTELAKMTGIDQSTISKIVADKQPASKANIEAFAVALKVDGTALTDNSNPVFHSENQQGGHANNYFSSHNCEALVAAKDETIKVLKKALEAAEIRERNLMEQIDELKKSQKHAKQ